MRQAFRRYAFPMMIIAAVLAAALPLNCFAGDNLSFDILPASGDRVSAYSGSQRRSLFPSTTVLYGWPGTLASSPTLTANFSSFSLGSSSFYNTSSFIDVSLPIYRSGISSFDFDVYFGVANGLEPDLNFALKNVFFQTSSGLSYDVTPLLVDSGKIFTSSSTSRPTNNFYNFQTYNLHFSSSTTYDITKIHLRFYWRNSTSFLTDSSKFYFGIADNASLTSINGQTESLLNSIGIVASILESIYSSNLQSDVQIIDYLAQILSVIQSGSSDSEITGPPSQESEDILNAGAEKQEQLEQLGDALSNVPKPSIENITQSFDPADTLISADPGMIQNALSIVYSWDKFLILLGLFIAVGTISYIIFGKKS